MRFELRSAVVGSVAAGVANQLALVCSGIIVAHALGPEDRGLLALVFVLSVLAHQIGGLGVPTAVTYVVARGEVGSGTVLAALSGFRRRQLVIVLLAHLGLAWVVLLPRSPPDFAAFALLSLCSTAAGLSQMYGLSVLQGDGRFLPFNLLRLSNGVLYALGVAVLWIAGAADLRAVTVVVIASNTLAAVATSLVLRRHRGNTGGHVDTRALMSFGSRALLGSAPPIEIFRLDQLLVGLLLPPIALGYFVVALAFSNLSRFIGQSIGMVTYPRVAEEAEHATQLRVIRRDAAFALIVVGTTTVALWIAIPFLLPLFFGSAFEPAVLPAQVLLVGALFASIRRVLIDGARGAGRPTWGAGAEAATLVALPSGAALAYMGEATTTSLSVVVAASNAIGLMIMLPVLTAPRQRRRLGHDLGRTTRKTIQAGGAMIVCVGSAALAGYSITRIPGDHSALLAVLLGLALVLPIAVRLAQKRFDPFEPLVLFAVAYGAMFVVRPLAMYAREEMRYERATSTIALEETFPTVLVLALTGGLAFLGGYFLPLGRKVAARLPVFGGTIQVGTAVRSALIVAAVGITLTVVFLDVAGGSLALILAGRSPELTAVLRGSSSYLSHGPYLLVPSILVLFAVGRHARRPQYYITGGVLTLAILLLAVPTGSRMLLLPFLGGAFVHYYVVRRSRPRALTLVVVGSLALFLSVLLLDARVAGYGASEGFRATVSSVAQNPSTALDPLTTESDAEMAPALGAALTVIPDDFGFFRGRATVGDLLARPIPRELWPEKPLSPREQLIARLWPTEYARGSANPEFSVLLYFYWDFGLAGVLAGMGFLGIAARSLYAYHRQHERQFAAGIMFALLTPFLVIGLRDSPVDTAMRMAFMVIPLVWILRRSTGLSRCAIENSARRGRPLASPAA